MPSNSGVRTVRTRFCRRSRPGSALGSAEAWFEISCPAHRTALFKHNFDFVAASRAQSSVRPRSDSACLLKHSEIADRIATVLALLIHDDAEALTDRPHFLGISGCRRTRTDPFELVIGKTVDQAADQCDAVPAHLFHLCE